MSKLILTGWFIIKMHTVDGAEHNYLLEDPVKNRMISATLDAPLSYDENTWIKLSMVATCATTDEAYQVEGIGMTLHKNLHICDAEKVEELKCTERNSFVVNGIPYC